MKVFSNSKVHYLHPSQYLANLKSQDLKANMQLMLDMPYDADPILEPEFIGMTYRQVIIYRQIQLAVKGDGAAVDRIWDRIEGRPTQVNTNVNVNGTYKDFLTEVARKEGFIDVDATSIE